MEGMEAVERRVRFLRCRLELGRWFSLAMAICDERGTWAGPEVLYEVR